MPKHACFLFLMVTLANIFIGCHPAEKSANPQLSVGKLTRHNNKGTLDMNCVSGPLKVDITPAKDSDPKMGRMHLKKTYSGGLQAIGTGQMLTGVTDVKGSAGYVAIEKVDGKLEGRKGSFLIQHSGIQQGESKHLTIQVIPDSGSGELTGIEGSMDISVSDSGHQYKFQYVLAGSASNTSE